MLKSELLLPLFQWVKSQQRLIWLLNNSTRCRRFGRLFRKNLDWRTKKTRYYFFFIIIKFYIFPCFSGSGRKKPQFEHKLWNIHDRIITGIPRSNNSVEGWHNAFASRVAINHQNIIKLTEKIRREQSKFEIDIAKILQGHEVQTKKACYRKLDERITRLVSAYDSSQLDQYLKNTATNVTL